MANAFIVYKILSRSMRGKRRRNHLFAFFKLKAYCQPFMESMNDRRKSNNNAISLLEGYHAIFFISQCKRSVRTKYGQIYRPISPQSHLLSNGEHKHILLYQLISRM
ncbi:hypothetical protein KFK09_023767 [Dendrobium nobile]|uniref:Uncharacterized protein n=1 Tax=Dendrobium nobile TaxID=94219 RepID=A0A8T3AAP5_DENNO|nr:hypothetical protein KFK09_023767 [Dendrobium nobile]